ncbi:hypothetical protein SLA2020_492100 [Shorea laevis]
MSFNSSSYLSLLSLYLLLLLVSLPTPAFSGETVNYLPGYDGELPFYLETGYISVNDSELFYYFIESQGNPEEDPLFLWLTGGPGCSSFSGIIYEVGPIEFDIENYTGGLPKLRDYKYAWTKTASFIFLDAPVGTGYSYSTTQEGWYTSDSKSAEQSYQFLIKWLIKHPKYLNLQLFIGGDSYSGITVPLVTQKIIENNMAPASYPRMNLKGYLLGSPTTDAVLNSNAKIEFAHRLALISDELNESLKTSCNGSYVNVDPSNADCVAALAEYDKCIADIWTNSIIEPNCVFASPKMNLDIPRRSLEQHQDNFILSPLRIPDFWCRAFNYTLAYKWANDVAVRDALHVRPGTVDNWLRCNLTLSYTKDVQSVIDVHRYLSNYGLLVLVQSGDRDMVVPFTGTQTWIKSLNLTINFDWRPWFVDGQVAGYNLQYEKNDLFWMTYATVKGAGHTAPEYYRRECFEMFKRWVHYYPL